MELDLGFHLRADAISPGPLVNFFCCGYFATVMLLSPLFSVYAEAI